MNKICKFAIEDIKDKDGIYNEEKLIKSCSNIIRPGMTEEEILLSVMQCALELTTESEPKWQYAASKIYIYKLYKEVSNNRGLKEEKPYSNFYNFIEEMTAKNLYGKYILENYSQEEVAELEKYIKPERDYLFTYSGIDLLAKRYLIHDYNKNTLELPQQMFMGIAMVLMAVLLVLVRPIVGIMSTPAEAVEGTVRYLTICFIGIPFITAYNIISSIFRGMGDSKSPMYFIAVACAANIGLDYLFIGLLGLDAAGAALGTTIAQAISVVVSMVVILKRKSGIRLEKSDFRPKRMTMKNILKVGVPVCLQDGFIQVSFVVITIFANQRGLTDAAAVGIVEKIISILFLVPSSMMSTISALVAQNIGAGKHDRAKLTLKYVLMITVTYGLIMTIIVQFVSVPLVGLFTNDGAVAVSGAGYLRSYASDCIFAGIHFCLSGYFYAYGLSVISFIHNSISIVCARIPLSYYASVHFKDTLFPMGCAAPAGSLISVVICVGVFIWLEHHEDKYQNI